MRPLLKCVGHPDQLLLAPLLRQERQPEWYAWPCLVKITPRILGYIRAWWIRAKGYSNHWAAKHSRKM